MRTRDLVIAVLAGIVVIIVVAFGWTWLRGLFDETTDAADPAAVAQAWVEAWEAQDHAAMLELTRTIPADLGARHDQLLDGLGAHGIDLELGPVREEVDGRAIAPVAVFVDVPYNVDPVHWDVRLTLIRERGEWSVDWDLTAIHPELRDTWEFGTESEPVVRSAILSSDGTPLAAEGTLVTIGFEPSTVRDPDALVAAFERAVPGSGTRAEREVNRANLVDGWFYPVVTLTEDRGDRAWSDMRGVAGVLRQTSEARAPVADGFAQHVVGVIAEATAEQLEQRRQAGLDAEPGLHVPQYGLELVMDGDLEGSDLVRAGLREADGPMRVVLSESQQDPSGPVHTTLDVDVQRAVEEALDGIDLAVGFVVVDAADGAIRASASRPLSGYNRAFAGRYPPGSTFKIVTAEALLADGTTEDTEVGCPAEQIVGGLRVPNAGGFEAGTVTFTEAFTRSCNTTFAAMGARVGADGLAEAAQRFGFGIDPRVPLTAFGGSFPAPQDQAEAAAASFGQGRVESSALHMASVAAATWAGTWHQPYLLVDDGPGASSRLTVGTIEPLGRLLRAAVVDGTGRAADVDGQTVRGKTGTAQGTGGEHAWFVGTHEGLGFAIVIEGGGSGGDQAAPIAARFVQRLTGAVGAEAAGAPGGGGGTGQ
ncbi:MAG: penicillin-binding transpeptidase domain-containing protein [Nitriliruptoraceae bacterium]